MCYGDPSATEVPPCCETATKKLTFSTTSVLLLLNMPLSLSRATIFRRQKNPRRVYRPGKYYTVPNWMAMLQLGGVKLPAEFTAARNSKSISRIAGPMCPVLDTANVTTVNFFHGNGFYMARRAKLAWLLLAWHWAFLGIQDGGRHHLRCGTFFNCSSW